VSRSLQSHQSGTPSPRRTAIENCTDLSPSLALLVWFFLRLGTGILHSMENATQFVHGTPRDAASQRTWIASVLLHCLTSGLRQTYLARVACLPHTWNQHDATVWLPRYSACRDHRRIEKHVPRTLGWLVVYKIVRKRCSCGQYGLITFGN